MKEKDLLLLNGEDPISKRIIKINKKLLSIKIENSLEKRIKDIIDNNNEGKKNLDKKMKKY